MLIICMHLKITINICFSNVVFIVISRFVCLVFYMHVQLALIIGLHNTTKSSNNQVHMRFECDIELRLVNLQFA